MEKAETTKQAGSVGAIPHIQFFGGKCPACGKEVFVSAYSAVVTCPECDNVFAIEVERPKIRTGTGIKIPRGLPTL